MSFELQIAIATIGFFVILLFGFLFLASRWRKKAEHGQALIVTGGNKGIAVSFNYAWVIPILHKLEIMDISRKSFSIERKEKEGLICKDYLRVDIKMTFVVQIEPSFKSVKMVAQNFGVKRVNDVNTPRQLFEAKFAEAMKSIAKEFDLLDLHQQQKEFKKEVVLEIGALEDFFGYCLESVTIDYLNSTPIEFLDPNNILDAQALKKIKEQNKL